MKKVNEALKLLSLLGLPKGQRNERSALSLLAFANLKSNSKWSEAKQVSMSIVGDKDESGKYPGIMFFINKHYAKVRTYKENSRESFRDETVKPFVQAGICEHNPEEPGLAPNSKNNHYRLTTEVLKVMRSFGTDAFEVQLENFKKEVGTLTEKYAKARDLLKIPIKLSNGKEFKFAPGKHNELQASIINVFAATFAHDSLIVYIGDAADRQGHMDEKLLKKLNIPMSIHGKLPDVILYNPKKDWLFLIEAVTSVGPISPQRLIDLEKFLKKCAAGKIYVTAFPDRATFRSHMANIAWETEVWISNEPTHLIHFNGDRFMGPR